MDMPLSSLQTLHVWYLYSFAHREHFKIPSFEGIRHLMIIFNADMLCRQLGLNSCLFDFEFTSLHLHYTLLLHSLSLDNLIQLVYQYQ
jgi:hypothetical protein